MRNIASSFLITAVFALSSDLNFASAQTPAAPPPGPTTLSLDATTMGPFSYKVKGYAGLSRTGETPSAWSFGMWQEAGVGEIFLKEEPIVGFKGIGIVNLEGPPSAQFVFDEKVASNPGIPHALVIEYLTQGDCIGVSRINDNTAHLDLPSTGGTWKTAWVKFVQAAGEGRTLFIQNLRSGLSNGLYLRRVEIRVLGPGADVPAAPSPVQPGAPAPQPVSAQTEGKVFFSFDAATAKPFRMKKKGDTDLAKTGELPQPWSFNTYRSDSVGEIFIQEEPVAGSKAWGMVNLEGEASLQIYLWQALELPPGVPLQLTIEYLTLGSGFGVAVPDPGPESRLDSTGGTWKTVTQNFQRSSSEKSGIKIQSLAQGAGNALYFRRVEIRQIGEAVVKNTEPLVKPVKVPANNAAIRYVGRWDASEPTQRRAYWPATYFKFAFSGRRIALELDEDIPSSFFVSIDSLPPQSFSKQRGLVEITPGKSLGDGVHQVLVGSEAGKSINLNAVVLEKGASLGAAKIAPKTVMFISDSASITASGDNPTLDTWASRTATALGVEQIQIAQNGIGLVSGSETPLGKVGMDRQFSKGGPYGTPLDRTEFAATGELPHVIVIHLGTNDAIDDGGKVSLDAFKAGYKKLLADLRLRYPTAMIATLEIFQSSPAKNAAILAAVEETAASTADKKTLLIKTAGWINLTAQGGDIVSESGAPSAQGHTKIAAKLAEALRPLLK